MKSTDRLLVFFISFLSLNAISYGQTEDTRRFAFRLVSWKNQQPAEVMYVQNGQPIAVKGLQTAKRSDMQFYSGGGSFALYEPITLVDGQIPLRPTLLANVTVPESVMYPLIILVPNEAGKSPAYRAWVLNDDPDVFPFPSYFIFNLSNKPVAIGIGEKQFILQPGTQQRVTSTANTLNLQMAVPREETEGWKLVYDNFFPNWSTERNLMFITDVPRNGRTYVEPRVLIESENIWKLALEKLKERQATSPGNP